MGSIDQHQLAGLYLQPEAAQDNLHDCQNNSAMLCLPDPFPHPHTKEKKGVWLRETRLLQKHSPTQI